MGPEQSNPHPVDGLRLLDAGGAVGLHDRERDGVSSASRHGAGRVGRRAAWGFVSLDEIRNQHEALLRVRLLRVGRRSTEVWPAD